MRVHSIGPEPELRDLLDEHLENEDLPIVIHHASERIGMEEKAVQAVRTKQDSSMRVGLKLVRDRQGKGFRDCGQYGRGDGDGEDGAGHASGRRPARAGHSHADLRREMPACCWTWAPMWIASRTTWSNLR